MDLFSITIDIDWAPDFAIYNVAQTLIENNVKSTWFVTHSSPAIDFLRSRPDLFELGLHPNFLPGSSHGNTENEIIAYAQSLVPGSKITRSHALVQTSPLLYKMAKEFGIEIDLSLFLWGSANISPHVLYLYDRPLLRIPYFWEDDTNTYTVAKTWDFGDKRHHVPGLKIFNFHPMYVYLNTDTMSGYEALKKIRYLADLTEEEVAPYINNGAGAGTLFNDMIKSISESATYTVSDIAEIWLKDNPGHIGINSMIR